MKLYDSSQQSFYDSAVLSSKRAWSADIGTASSETYPGCLRSFKIKECMSDGKNITMGNTISKQLTVNLMNVPAAQKTHFYEGAEIDVFINLYDYLGSANSCKIVTSHFYLDKPKFTKSTNGNYSISITAYDKIYQMSKVFSYSGTSYLTSDILQYIGNKYDLEIASDAVENDYTLAALDEEITDKEMLGYIAGLYGKSAYINDDNELSFKWYTEYSTPVTSKCIYQGSDITEDSESRTIKMLESGTQSNILVYPSSALGYSINFENPFMTDEYLQSIYVSKIANDAATYTVGKFKFKGDPLMNAGSIVTVTDREGVTRPFWVMQRTLSYDGGLYDTLECHGESETTIAYRNISPTEKRINRALSKMEEAIKAATDAITQTQGSIFELIPVDENDTSKGNSGWKLRSQITDNVIIANSTGIGFSSDGGKTFSAAAIYIDEYGEGHINTNYITTGFIQGKDKNTYFDLDNSVIATIKHTSSGEFPYYSFEYSGGGVSGKYVISDDSETMVGGFLPYNQVVINSTDIATGFYGWFGDSLTIFQSETGTLDDVNLYVSFYSDKIDISKPIESIRNIKIYDLSGSLQTGVSLSTAGFVESSSTDFSAHTHCRYDEENLIYGMMKSGVGKRTVTSMLDFSDYAYANTTSKEKNGYTYDARIGLSTSGVYRLTEWMNVGDADQLNVSFNAGSYGWAYFHFVYKKAESDLIYMDTSEGSDLLLALVENVDTAISKIITIPSDAVTWAIAVTPHTLSESYWAGWRDVTIKALSIRPTASLELWDFSGENMQTRLDIAKTDGEAMGIIRLQNGSSQSANLELGTNNMWFKGYPIYSTLVDLSEKVDTQNIQSGIIKGVTSSGTSVIFEESFTNEPIVICTPLQAYAGSEHMIIANITAKSTSGFTVVAKDMIGSYGSDIMWFAFGA